MSNDADMQLAETITVGGLTLRVDAPPEGLALRASLGLLTHESITGQVVHRTPKPEVCLFEVRATITPGGHFLAMFPEGDHYGGHRAKVNRMLACRSADRGKTWSDAAVAFDIPYSQHGFIPLIPRGSTRIYAFGTQPILEPGHFDGRENASIGFRSSDDDGHTWSDVTLIRPTNDPGFLGMSVMRMCETEDGTWLLGSHEGDWTRTPVKTRQYILRSTDQGRTWNVLPHPRPDGWFVHRFNRMDELRPIALGGGNVLAIARTPEGHLWSLRSRDHGKGWTDPKPTALVHPDAPPMVFPLADGSTLAAFHHNRHTGGHFAHVDRSEVWVALSTDQGHKWSEPRFVFANALAPTLGSDFRNHQCSYIDAIADGGQVHLFVPHRWRQVLHLQFPESALQQMPTRGQLAAALQ